MAESRQVLITANSPATPQRRSRKHRKIVLWICTLILIGGALLFIALEVSIHRAEPILKARIIDTLATRYDSRVELDQFHVSVLRGFEAEGSGLRIYPKRLATDRPLFSVSQFNFRISWLDLLHSPMHVSNVFVTGLDIHMPPKQQRAELPSLNPGPSPSQRGVKIHVDQVVIENAHLVLGASKPGKTALDFAIRSIRLNSGQPGQPVHYDATLINPKPLGDIHSTGYFGPFQQDSPGDTPVKGTYVFSHADLGSFKGIGGMLSSTGKFQGPLDHLIVDGTTDVPDFRLTLANRPMHLRTTFHAIVDGVNGDTYLEPVDAQLANSHFVCQGKVVRVPGHGHEVTLDVNIENARIEDFLNLAVRTQPPVMSGALRMTTKFDLPPGRPPVPERLKLDGQFVVSGATFSNPKVQDKVDDLSLISEGHPQEAKLQAKPTVASDLSGDFTMADAKLDFSRLDFRVPGAIIAMNGIYTLDGTKFDFHGKAKLHAHVSEMTTGWKSVLLKAVDPFFAKHGFGTEVPIEVNGTKSEPHFGLDFGKK